MGDKRNSLKRCSKRKLKRLKYESVLICHSKTRAKWANRSRQRQNENIMEVDPEPLPVAVLNNGKNNVEHQATYSQETIRPEQSPFAILNDVNDNNIEQPQNTIKEKLDSQLTFAVLKNVENNVDHQATYSQETVRPERSPFAILNDIDDNNMEDPQSTNNEELASHNNAIPPQEHIHKKRVTKKKSCVEQYHQEILPEQYDDDERLIIDKKYFFENLKRISNHGPQFGCTLSNLNITGETRKGLNSKLKFTCSMCRAEFFLNTTNPQATENLDVNTAAVTGITNTGIGLEQFQGLFAAMNLPLMSRQLFTKKHDEICEQLEKTAHEVMAAAAEREKEAAIADGRVKNGVPVIDVIADGCWSKRSYKKKYSALSGAAAIVGRRFGEVLYLGVKNKYCCICARAQNKGTPPKEHTCFKNYSGASSGMEAAIIAEGFKNSLDMYGIIYGRVIADGDANTYNRIREERPYPNFTVEKIECRNHVLRNMCNKLASVGIDTKYPKSMRKMLTTQRILAIRKAICLAIKNIKKDREMGTQINSLYTDISNSYNHAFGHHENCLGHYCNSEKKSENLVPKISNSVFWARIQYIVGTVAGHSRSLVHDYDSNAVEQFNSIIAKLVAGKRTNLIQRQSYQSRCAAAVIAYNTKRPLYNLQKSLLGKSPKSKLIGFEKKRLIKNTLRRLHKKPKRINFDIKPQAQTGDKNYGTDTCEKPDMTEDMYNLAKTSFLKNLQKTDAERVDIEKATILQRNCSEWLELRRNLLTASNFGKVIKRRATTSASIVKALLYKSNLSNVAAIKHGIENEPIALKQLADQENVDIRPCGLFIDSNLPFLAATPDGLIGNDKIVEIKCPLSAYKMPIKEAVAKRKVKFWVIKNNQMVINKNDAWYFQVQGQLHVTNKKMCLIAVWSGETQDMVTETILRDDAFWHQKMVEKLEEFYMHHLLPELIDPRLTRNMKLRQPNPEKVPERHQEPVASESSVSPSPSPCLSESTLITTQSTHVLSISQY